MSRPPASAHPRAESSWAELFRGPLALYTLLLNLGLSLQAIDIFVIATIMPTVVADIGGVAYYAWAIMLYIVGSILGAASFSPSAAALGGRYAYALGGIVYLVGAIACALAPEMLPFLAGRTVQGFGAGIAMAGSYAMTGTLFEPRLRTRVFATTNVTWTIATLIGPLLGGAFAQIHWWQGAFWSLVPIAMGFVAVVWWKVPAGGAKPREARPSFPLLRLGLLGIGVLCIASAGRVAEGELRWLLVAIAPLLVWYAFRRDEVAENRLFPSRALSLNAPVGAGYWVQFLVGAAQTTLYIYLPLVLQAVQGLAPLFVGLLNAALSLAWSVGAAISAPWSRGWERLALILGLAMMLAAVAALGVDLRSASLTYLTVCAMVFGFGMGMYNPHALSKTMSAAAKGEETVTSSSLATVRALGTAFGASASALIANIAGLQSVSGAEGVAVALTWVFVWDVVPLAFAMLSMFRFLQLLARPVAVPTL